MKWNEDIRLCRTLLNIVKMASFSKMASHMRVLNIAVIGQTCFIRVLSAVKSFLGLEYGWKPGIPFVEGSMGGNMEISCDTCNNLDEKQWVPYHQG